MPTDLRLSSEPAIRSAGTVLLAPDTTEMAFHNRRTGFPAISRLISVVAKRLLAAVIQLFIVSIMIFVVLRAMPADPTAMLLPPEASLEDLAQLRQALALDKSVPIQYFIWVDNVLHGDFGQSTLLKQPVFVLIGSALPMTLELVFVGLTMGITIGFALALASFYWRGGLFEAGINLFATISQSIPEFLWGILLVLVFGATLQLVPFTGPIDPKFIVPSHTGFLLVDSLINGQFDAFISRLSHLLLAGLAIGMAKAPLVVWVLRSSLLETYSDDYIMSARLRGLSEGRILFGHALRNAVLPTISLIGVQAGFTFGGTLLIEAIYSFPGLGNLMISAVRSHDLMLIQAITLTYCGVVLMMSAAVDLIYLWANPRLRRQ
jgi:ABC-type dipeptide/oligopeptide/nickel transport system permease component